MKKNSIKAPQSLEVLYEDNHLLIVNKPPGVLIQGDKTGDLPLVDIAKKYIKGKYNKPGDVFLGVVHRLDRPTSGAVVFARTSKALIRLNEQFKLRETQKVYWAMVEGTDLPKENRLIHWMVRNTKQNKSYAYVKKVANSKEAILDFKRLKTLERYSCLEINLHTGRHHQIRAQLAALGYSIKGDLKYGASRSNANGSIHLHARKLSLMHPVKKEVISITAPTPKDALWNACVGEGS